MRSRYVYLSLFLLVISILFSGNISHAQRMQKKYEKEIINSITFEEGKEKTNVLDNGLTISFARAIADSYYYSERSDERLDRYYWFRYGMYGDKYIYGASGAVLDITNSSNEIKIVEWGGSIINMGEYSGVPAIGGMKYIDFGRPGSTPNTVIPPQQTKSVKVFIGQARWFGTFWQCGYICIEPNNDPPLKIELTMKVTDESNTPKYYTIQSPNIILPLHIIEKYKKD